ncbi:GNAT family N-acetyltransferase [Flavihumibacter petaseus]|uniref:Putative acetyltransferase n=1 Tax=Flavihumibacter petaseus NBRC 106054 TaxID=1220578 RepID=A0A0E9N0W2_9BACT|nr:GNAT family N-acetyltransferase [Flavihumibacter petaseus]GAO43474.1 putative acetyltransferase [Flavihumibacter petaseus NBRC 106054]
MLIKHTQQGDKGVFYVGEEGAFLAEMAYSQPYPDRMIIEHTEVSETLKGQHVGEQLVETAVQYARTHNLKIVPLCPFAHAVMKRKKEEYADVL